MRFLVILIFFGSLLFPLFLLGGVGPAPDPCPPTHPDFPNCLPVQAPITEAIVLLLAGAIGFGVKTFSKKTKK